MLRLNFRSIKGDAPTLTVATFFRFHADGTLRGPENYLVARCVDGCWHLSGRMHRELDCEGPVKLRFSMGANDVPVMLGPFATCAPRPACSTATTPASTFSCPEEIPAPRLRAMN